MPILSEERVFPRKFLALYVYPPKARFRALFVAFPNIIHIPDNESIEELYGIRRRYFMLINKTKKYICLQFVYTACCVKGPKILK